MIRATFDTKNCQQQRLSATPRDRGHKLRRLHHHWPYEYICSATSILHHLSTCLTWGSYNMCAVSGSFPVYDQIVNNRPCSNDAVTWGNLLQLRVGSEVKRLPYVRHEVGAVPKSSSAHPSVVASGMRVSLRAHPRDDGFGMILATSTNRGAHTFSGVVQYHHSSQTRSMEEVVR